MPEDWTLIKRITLSGGDLAYDVLGPPLLLIQGTPSRSCIWRNIALRLADSVT